MSTAFSTTEQLRVEIKEYIDQNVIFNPLKTGAGSWFDNQENQTFYNLTGYIVVTNQNPEGSPINDIYITFDYTTNITGTPTLHHGRTGTWRGSDPTTNGLALHIPEILNGENSTWIYSINTTNIRPPLNFTASYSAYKALAGDNVTINDTLHNIFDNVTYQSADTCIHQITVTQNALAINFSGTFYNYSFINFSTLGADAGNVSYSANNLTQTWYVLGGGCLDKDDKISISYNVSTPYNIPTSTNYYMINASLEYRINQSISRLRVTDVRGIGAANISFEKQISKPTDPILYGSNVTWNVTGYFSTGTSLNYTLHEATFWVSRRNFNGTFTDPNYVDNDTVDGKRLNISYFPSISINRSGSWQSAIWSFNYTDIPSPIVWMDVNFSITNDGVQLINRSVSQNGDDFYLKEIYLIIGYWLEIEKNLTALGSDIYQIFIDVHNKGNQVTPANSIVTVYDFMPDNFERSSAFVYSSSAWYSTATSNNSIGGAYNGTLFQWALIPGTSLNTSLAAGPGRSANNTWNVTFNVTGVGDYQLLNVFITGLDPQKVDGAGSTRAVVVEEILSRVKSTEGIFAVVAAILLLLGVLL